jgi:flagella synthesis protein FlgN
MGTSFVDLQNCLSNEIGLVKRFLDVLDDEARALAQTDNNSMLVASTRQKNQFADRLAEAASLRNAILAKLGFSSGKAGLDEAAKQDPSIKGVCDELFSLAEQARGLNIENGTVIEMYLEQNQRAIQALRTLASDSGLYNAKGQTA